MVDTKQYHLICNTLQELITDDYIFLDLPYYPNVGDVLIWEATLQLLRKIRHRCLYSCSIGTYRKPQINKNTILLFSGGGNFGDLWESHQRFRHQVLADFPENPVVQLPQSVWFEDDDKMRFDIQCYQNHQARVTICLRDQQSFDIISKNYPNVKPVLLPDLTLALDIEKVLKRNRITRQEGKGSLLVRREDKEFVENHQAIPFDAVGDWPCMTDKLESVCKYEQLMEKLDHCRVPARVRRIITRWYYHYRIKDACLCNGIRFLIPYRTIYATRLHAAILGVLLGKQVYILDNSYHKCSGVYNLWMKDMDNVSLCK